MAYLGTTSLHRVAQITVRKSSRTNTVDNYQVVEITMTTESGDYYQITAFGTTIDVQCLPNKEV